MPYSSRRILVIEDSEAYAGLLKIHLSRALPGVKISHELTLSSAIDRMEREVPDAIILDLHLPDSHGLDTFTQVHARSPEVPVLVLTGYEDEDIATLAMGMGAEDYLSKNEINGKTLARSLKYAIERHRWQEQRRELETAGTIQRSLFPSGPMALESVVITGRCDSMSATGGDYYDYFLLDEQRLGFVVADVSGHGVGPALIMTETRAALRVLCTMFTDPGQILTHLNRFLGDHLGVNGFVTLFLGQIDLTAFELRYAAAGHNGLLLRDDGNVRELEDGDVPLGIDSSTVYSCSEAISLTVADLIVVHTDGISEAMSPQRDLFQVSGVIEAVQQHRHQDPSEIISRLFQKSRDFTGRKEPSDDMTAIVAKVMYTPSELDQGEIS